MNLSDNIKNAFNVVVKTYDNVLKLMNYCDEVAESMGYVPVTDKFLRQRSDLNKNGWLYRSLFKIYQDKNDILIEGSELREGPIYSIEFNFEDEPVCCIGKFEYENMMGFKKQISPGDSWLFYYPTLPGDNRLDFFKIDSEYTYSVPKEKYKSSYWGLNRAIFRCTDLTQINSENLNTIIFGEFNILKNK